VPPAGIPKNALALASGFGKLSLKGETMQLSTLGNRIEELAQDVVGSSRARTCQIVEPTGTAFPIEIRRENQRVLMEDWQELVGDAALAKEKIKNLFSSTL
jgi:hypothetical protein